MKAKYIAENGILIALTIIILYASSIIPINTLSILTIASCLIPISIIRTSVKSAIIVYAASTILSLFLTPTNIALYYALFFGAYGIIKYFIEKIRNMPIELLLKLFAFNILITILYFIITNLLINLNLKAPLYIIWLVGQIAFLIYDYALTLIISFYLNRIHKII